MKKKNFIFHLLLTSIIVALVLSGCGRNRRTVKRDSDDIEELRAQLSIIETKLDAVMEKQEFIMSESAPEKTRPVQKAGGPALKITDKRVQKALYLAGYDPGVIDGRIGKKTKSAIKAFQRDHGLKVDGIAGKETKKYLRNYL